MTWSPDGNRLAFSICFDGYPSEVFVRNLSVEGHALTKLHSPTGVSLAGSVDAVTQIAWRSDEKLLFLGRHHARTRVYETQVAPLAQLEPRCVTPGDVSVWTLSATEDGGAVVTLGTPMRLKDLYLLDNGDHLAK